MIAADAKIKALPPCGGRQWLDSESDDDESKAVVWAEAHLEIISAVQALWPEATILMRYSASKALDGAKDTYGVRVIFDHFNHLPQTAKDWWDDPKNPTSNWIGHRNYSSHDPHWTGYCEATHWWYLGGLEIQLVSKRCHLTNEATHKLYKLVKDTMDTDAIERLIQAWKQAIPELDAERLVILGKLRALCPSCSYHHDLHWNNEPETIRRLQRVGIDPVEFLMARWIWQGEFSKAREELKDWLVEKISEGSFQTAPHKLSRVSTRAQALEWAFGFFHRNIRRLRWIFRAFNGGRKTLTVYRGQCRPGPGIPGMACTSESCEVAVEFMDNGVLKSYQIKISSVWSMWALTQNFHTEEKEWTIFTYSGKRRGKEVID